MKICAVIAEFNPFHNGHLFLINEIKKRGFTHIIAIMSGNFVQRGEPAIISEKVRAKIALNCAVDLVIEMPCAYSVATAEKYAESGVLLAESLKCADALIFGSECGDLSILKNIASLTRRENYDEILKKHLSKGITFAEARELTFKDLMPDFSNFEEIVQNPNNILGIEYLKAIKKYECKITPLTIKRTDSQNPNYLSASKIREMIINKNLEYEKYVPKACFEIIKKETENLNAPANLSRAEQSILYRLKTMNKKDFLNFPGISEGIENRLEKKAKTACSLDEFLNSVKTKRYTMSRIKKIVLCAYLGVKSSLQETLPSYIKILGTSKKGLEILKKIKSECPLPVISRYSHIKNLKKSSKNFFEKECEFASLYKFFTPKISFCEKEESFKIVKGDNFDV